MLDAAVIIDDHRFGSHPFYPCVTLELVVHFGKDGLFQESLVSGLEKDRAEWDHDDEE